MNIHECIEEERLNKTASFLNKSSWVLLPLTFLTLLTTMATSIFWVENQLKIEVIIVLCALMLAELLVAIFFQLMIANMISRLKAKSMEVK